MPLFSMQFSCYTKEEIKWTINLLHNILMKRFKIYSVEPGTQNFNKHTRSYIKVLRSFAATMTHYRVVVKISYTNAIEDDICYYFTDECNELIQKSEEKLQQYQKWCCKEYNAATPFLSGDEAPTEKWKI